MSSERLSVGNCRRFESVDDTVEIVVETRYSVDVVLFDQHNSRRIGETEFVVGIGFVCRHRIVEERR